MAKQIFFGTLDGHDALVQGEEVLLAAGAFLDERPWISGCILHISRLDALTSAIFGKVPPDGTNVAMEVWTPEGRAIVPDETPFDCFAAYQVDEIVEKGDGRFALGALQGVTMVSRVHRKCDISLDQFRLGYDRHPLVALRVHVGMESYVRHHINAATLQDAESISGISCLHFATDEDYTDRLYKDDEGRAAIATDVAGFMDREKSISMLARSFVLK